MGRHNCGGINKLLKNCRQVLCVSRSTVDVSRERTKEQINTEIEKNKSRGGICEKELSSSGVPANRDVLTCCPLSVPPSSIYPCIQHLSLHSLLLHPASIPLASIPLASSLTSQLGLPGDAQKYAVSPRHFLTVCFLAERSLKNE